MSSVTARSLAIAALWAAAPGGGDGSAQRSPSGSAWVVRDIALVDVRGETIRPAQDILVVGDRIEAIAPTGTLETPEGTRTIEGTGLYAAPGLVDMHVHLSPDDLPLYVANGVTAIRVMNGSPEILAVREEVRRGLRPGPAIHTSGPLLAGTRQPWRHELVEDASAARLSAMLDDVAARRTP